MSLGRFIIAILILVIILYILNDVIITHIMPQYNVPSSYDSIISKSLFLIGGIGTYILALNTPNITKSLKKKKPSVLDVHEYICELKEDPSPTISEQKTGRGLDTKSGGFVMTEDAYQRAIDLYNIISDKKILRENKIAVVNKMYEDIGFIVGEPDPKSKDQKQTQVDCTSMQDALDLLTKLSNGKIDMIVDEKDKNKRQFPHSVYIEDTTDPDLNSRSTSADLNSNYILYDARRETKRPQFNGYTVIGYLMNEPDRHWIAFVRYTEQKWFICDDDKNPIIISNIHNLLESKKKTHNIAAILYKKTKLPHKYKDSSKPLGLPNLGNTCYLNALLQILVLMNKDLIVDIQDNIIDLHNKRDDYINKPNELSNKIADILWFYIQIAYPNIDQDHNGVKDNYDAFFQFLKKKNILNYNEQQNQKLKNIYEQAVFKDQKNIQEQLNTYNEDDLLSRKIYARYRTYYRHSRDPHKSDLKEKEKQAIVQLLLDNKSTTLTEITTKPAESNPTDVPATKPAKNITPRGMWNNLTALYSSTKNEPATKTPTGPTIGTPTAVLPADGPAIEIDNSTGDIKSKKAELTAAYEQLNDRVERVNNDKDLKIEFNNHPDWFGRWLTIMFNNKNVLKFNDSTEIQAMITEITDLYNTFPINDGESTTSLKPYAKPLNSEAPAFVPKTTPATEQLALNAEALAFIPATKATTKPDDEVSTNKKLKILLTQISNIVDSPEDLSASVVRESDAGATDGVTRPQAVSIKQIIIELDNITDSDISIVTADSNQLNIWLKHFKKHDDKDKIIIVGNVEIKKLIEKGEDIVKNIINKAVAAELRKSIVDTVSTISITTPDDLDDVDDEEADEVTDKEKAGEDNEIGILEAELIEEEEKEPNDVVNYLHYEAQATCEGINSKLQKYLADENNTDTNVNYIGDLKKIQRALLLQLIKKLKTLEKPRFTSQVIKKIKSITTQLKEKFITWNDENNIKDITNNIAVVLEMIKNPTFDDDEDFSFGVEPYSDYANSFKKLDQNERYGFGKTPFDKYFKELKNEEL